MAEIVEEGVYSPWRDHLSGLIRELDFEHNVIAVAPHRKLEANMKVVFQPSTRFWLDASPTTHAQLQIGLNIYALGSFSEHTLEAVSISLRSRQCQVRHWVNHSLRPISIRYVVFDRGQVLVRPFGMPGNTILLDNLDEFTALLKDTAELQKRLLQ